MVSSIRNAHGAARLPSPLAEPGVARTSPPQRALSGRRHDRRQRPLAQRLGTICAMASR
jgi:hypothetical protein